MMIPNNERVRKVLEQAGASDFGVCGFAELPPLLSVRAKARLPARAQSVIVFLFGYYVEYYPDRNISSYAIVDDYHSVVRRKLTDFADILSKEFPCNEFIPFVDSSPIVEVAAAALAGLGDVGRNGLLLSPVYGSRCFIGELVSDLALDNTRGTAGETCLGCDRCVAACPTGALSAAAFQKEKCRSHITQKKGLLTDWEREQIKAGGFVWGCDRCVDACPANRNAKKSTVAEFYEDIEPVVGYDTVERLCETKAYGWRGAAVLRRNLDMLAEKE